MLSSVTVSDISGWSFENIPEIEVSSGTYLRVSVICDSKRDLFDTAIPGKKEYIYIDSGVKSAGTQGFPDTTTSELWGVPDIEFVTEFIYPSTGVSKGYDTKSSNPGYLGFNAEHNLNGGNIEYIFFDSADNSSWTAWTEDITELDKKYVRWKALISSVESSTSPVIKELEINYNCPPESPSPVSPVGDSVKFLKPEFIWGNSFDLDGDTLTYSLEISPDENFATPYLGYYNIDENVVDYSSFTIPDNLYQAGWYWRMSATDTYSSSVWSSVFDLWVDTTSAGFRK